MLKLQQYKGFSILMALGITAILMILVSGLAVMYMREFKLSRLSYDEVLASSSAEGMFEYGMLKIRNHADGFQDSVSTASGDLDSDMFKLITPRSKWLEMKYEMNSNTGSYEKELKPGEFLVIPLGIGDDDPLSTESGKNAKKPTKNPQVIHAEWLDVSGINTDVKWTIAAMSGSENIGLQGSGAFNKTTIGEVQLREINHYCVDIATGVGAECTKSTYDAHPEFFPSDSTKKAKEELLYFYTANGSVESFMKPGVKDFWSGKSEQKNVTYENFYLILYNGSDEWHPGTTQTVKINASTNFALPEYSITSTATKGDASQVFRFSENKAGAYDALKYGYYNPN